MFDCRSILKYYNVRYGVINSCYPDFGKWEFFPVRKRTQWIMQKGNVLTVNVCLYPGLPGKSQNYQNLGIASLESSKMYVVHPILTK